MDADTTYALAAEHAPSFADMFQRQYRMALRQRTPHQRTQVQQILQNKLSQLTNSDAAVTGISPPHVVTSQHADSDNVVTATMRGPLGDLLEHIADQSSLRMATIGADAMNSNPELAVLEEFRAICTRIRLQGQIRRTLQPAPIDAGPLNSSTLVHRSLTLMRKVSPDYLVQFLSYLDTLAWMEQLCSGSAEQAKHVQNPKRPRKRARGKTNTPS